MELFTLPTLEVAARGSAPRFAIGTDGGSHLATADVTDVSWDGRLRRWFGNAAQYPFTVTLADATGATVLRYDKHRATTLTHLRVTARLADGRPIGELRQRLPAGGELHLLDDADVDVAVADIGTFSSGYRVVAEPERTREWARCEVTVRTDAARSFRLSFDPDAPVLVRALVLGHVLVADATLLPRGGRF